MGLVSVMPQPCTKSAPKSRSKRSIMLRGVAAPPTPMRLRPMARVSISGCASKYWNSISQMVGTACEKPTFSLRMSSYRLWPSMCGPGMTSFMPVIAAAYGMPHALAWNIGTASSSVICELTPKVSGAHSISECSTVERCEYSTPFGLPVVPEV